MTERERLFDWCVDQIQSGRMTVGQCVERHAGDDPDLAEMLRAVELLCGLTIPEMGAARLRVRARLADALNQDTADVTRDPAIRRARLTAPTAPTARAATRRPLQFLVGLAAAILLACGLLGWGAAQAAADVLPGNPLYTVKRVDEWLMLQTAFGDARHGVVLATLADHRLAEASAEARAGNAGAARALLREYDDDVRQAVALSAAMNARGEDTQQVLGAVAADLAHAHQLQLEATSQGNGSFAQLLQASLANDQQLIHANHLTLPEGTTTPNGQDGTNGSPSSPGHQGNAPTPSTGSPTPGGTATPPGNSHGSGSGNGNDGSHGRGQATPTPTAP